MNGFYRIVQEIAVKSESSIILPLFKICIYRTYELYLIPKITVTRFSRNRKIFSAEEYTIIRVKFSVTRSLLHDSAQAKIRRE